MKRGIIIITSTILFCVACSNNKPLTDVDRGKIVSDVKLTLDSIVKGLEQVKPELITNVALKTLDFTFLLNGMSGNYEEFKQGITEYYTPLTNQKFEKSNEKFAILDRSTVLYSCNCKFEVNFKNGKVLLQDPWSMQLLFKKSDNRWKLASWTEMGSEKVLKEGFISK